MTEAEERAALTQQIERKQLNTQIMAQQSAPVAAVPVEPAPAENAAAIEQYQNASVPEKALRGASNVAGGLWEGGVFDVIDMPANMVNLAGAGVHALGLTDEPYREQTPSERFGPLKLAREALTKRTVPKGASSSQDAFRTGASWGAGVLNPANVGKKVDTLMGGMAGAGEYLFGEDGQMAGMIPAVCSIVQALRGKAKAPKDEKQAMDFLDEVMADTPEAQANIDKFIAEGEVGTLADASGSPMAYNVENTLGPAGSPIALEVAKKNRQAEAGIVDDTGAVLPSDATDTSVRAAVEKVEGTQRRIAERAAAQQAELAAATGAKNEAAVAAEAAAARTIEESQAAAAALRGEAEAAQAPFTQGPSPAQASTALKTNIGEHERGLRELAGMEWKKFDDSPPVDASGTVKDVSKHLDKAIPDTKGADFKAFNSAYGPELKMIGDWSKKPASPTSIQAVLRDMRAKMHQAKVSGDIGHQHTIAAGVVNALEQSLIKSPTTKGYADAITATRRVYGEALPEKIQKTMISPNVETFARRLGFSGEEGANTARLANESNNPSTLKANDDYVRAAGGEEGVDEKFMAKYRGYLDERPELKAELQATADANTNAAKAETGAKATESKFTKTIKDSEAARVKADNDLAKASKAVRDKAAAGKEFAGKGAVGDYSRSPEGTEVIDGLLTGKDKGTAGLTDLMKWATKNDVADSFKSNVRQSLIKKLFPEKHGEKVVSGKAIDEFNKVKQSLIDSGVMTTADVENIDKALAKTQRQEARKASGKTIVDPKITPAEKIGATAGALAVVSTTGLPHALLATRLVRDGIEAYIKSSKLTKSARAKLDEFVVSPEKYREAYKLLAEYEKGGEALTKANTDRLIRAVVASGQAAKPKEE